MAINRLPPNTQLKTNEKPNPLPNVANLLWLYDHTEGIEPLLGRIFVEIEDTARQRILAVAVIYESKKGTEALGMLFRKLYEKNRSN